MQEPVRLLCLTRMRQPAPLRLTRMQQPVRLRCLTRVRQPARLHYLTRMHDGWGLQRVGPEEENIHGRSRGWGGWAGFKPQRAGTRRLNHSPSSSQ